MPIAHGCGRECGCGCGCGCWPRCGWVWPTGPAAGLRLASWWAGQVVCSAESQLALANFLLFSTPCFMASKRVFDALHRRPSHFYYFLCAFLICLEIVAAYLILTYLFLLCAGYWRWELVPPLPAIPPNPLQPTLEIKWDCWGQLGVSLVIWLAGKGRCSFFISVI